MSDQFLGEIRMAGFQFAPKGWAICNGQLVAISQNPALFAILGTTFGGDGVRTYALPNFQVLAPMAAGQGAGLSLRVQGDTGGEYNVALQIMQIPPHNHPVSCITGGGSQDTPSNNVWAADGSGRGAPPLYGAGANSVNMNPLCVQATGGIAPHNNMPPYLTVTFIIALEGIYPPRG